MSAPAHADDDARLRHEGERIEALLEEVSAMAGPQTWPRVEELVQRIVTLYGAGLERVLHHARSSGADTTDLDARLCADELVSSLLVLHGLHPRSTEERVRRALDRVRPYLGSHGGDVELVAIEGDVARLRLSGSCDGCPSSTATVEHTVRRAIEEDAPELVRIEVDGAPRELVQIGQKRRPRWEKIADLDRIATGAIVDVAGTSVLVLRIEGALLAYHSRCPSCGGALDPSRLREGAIECECGRGYDVARGGRAIDARAPHLSPLPLLESDGAHRVAIAERA